MFGLDRLLKVIDPDPVLIKQEQCLRARHARSSCRACSEVCPVDAIGFENRKLTVDSSRCTKCGLCLGACPTAALQVRGIDESRLDGAAVVRCQQAVGDGVVLPCLGALSVDHIVDLGSRQPGVVLQAADCETCALALGGRRAQERMAAAAEIMRALGVPEAPQWHAARTENVAPGEQAVSRRDLLSLWGQSAVQTGRTLLPDRQVNPVKLPADVPARRMRWLKRFTRPDGAEVMPWPTRQVSQACNGCKICTAFCPTGALAWQSQGDIWRLSFQAASCVDCHTCLDLCPRKAIAPGQRPPVAEVVAGERRDLAQADTKAKKPRSAYSGVGFDDLG